MSDLTIPRDEQYWLYGKEDVLLALRGLYYNDTLVTLFYKNIFCLSTVVDYNHEYVWLDISSNEKDGKFLIDKPLIYLKANAVSIPLCMELENGKLVELDNKPTWQFSLPKRVHKMQRREAFRVGVPYLIEGTIKLSDCDNHFKILDLSLTGIGLITDDEPNLKAENKHTLEINLPAYKDLPSIQLKTQVLVKHIVTTYNDKKKIGLQFYRLDRTQEMLLTKWQTKLQLLMSLAKTNDKL